MWTFKQLRGRRVPFDATLGGYIRDGIGGPPKKSKAHGAAATTTENQIKQKLIRDLR